MSYEPPQPPYVSGGSPPGLAPAPPALRPRSRRWPWILGITFGAVLLLCCGGALLAYTLGGDSTDQTAPAGQDPSGTPSTSAGATTAAAAAPPADTTARVGRPARDGQFEFVVTGVRCGVSTVGKDFLARQAQGQFCLVSVTVRNIGKEPRTFSDSNQKAFNTTGAEYAADGTAGISANPNGESLWSDINPGNSVTANVVFDIPKDATLTRLELHDSAFSRGVAIRL